MTATAKEKEVAKKVVVDFICRHKRAFDRYPNSSGIRYDKLEEKPFELLVGYVRLYNDTFKDDFGSLEYPFRLCLEYAGVLGLVDSVKTEIIYNDPTYKPPEGTIYYEMEFTTIIGEKRCSDPKIYETGFKKKGKLVCWEVPCQP